MMEQYFNLDRSPFKLSADGSFYFDSERHRRALSYLQYGLQQAEGFVVVTGDAGVGKSTLIERLLVEIGDTDVVAATISMGPVSQGDLIEHILSSFKIAPKYEGKVAQYEALQEFLTDQLEAGKQSLLIVDEAQNLSADMIEELRLLSNYTIDGSPLIQVFLVGQSGLRELIAQPEMDQLRQRIIASSDLDALSLSETADYIEHRLTVSGWSEAESLFTDVAVEDIFRHANGIPRNINKICGRALLQAALDEKDFVDAETAQKVIAELGSETVGRAKIAVPEEPRIVVSETNQSEEFKPRIVERESNDNIVPFAEASTEVIVEEESEPELEIDAPELSVSSQDLGIDDEDHFEIDEVDELEAQIIDAIATPDKNGPSTEEAVTEFLDDFKRRLSAIESDMENVRTHLDKLELARRNRSSVLSDHLKKLDGILKELVG